ncbi:hypothetical protein MNBD_PLANCTO03-1408 [hydrothermal vent metagenome]|uniref:FolM Alternative dihydrofolate reductase 1 n=1 Tax=hydrothermal vent metagenome TaxID=652676 RepID=A0A3B1DT11_9ZZZZ
MNTCEPTRPALPFSGERPIALVTGGARRVGRAICLGLAARGLDVLLTYRTSHEQAEATCERIRSAGVNASAAHLDLSDTGIVQTWSDTLAAALPRLDVLVHNASIYEPSPLETLDTDRAARQYQVNALAPLALTAALAPLLARSDLPGSGSVVAMLDIHAESSPLLGNPRRNHAAYAMSKAALGAMVRSLAVDLAPGIRVNGLAPGVIAWPETGPDADPAMQERYLSRVPLERAGTPEDAAAAVAFLALDAAYITGQVLAVDGGRSLR